MFEAFDILKKLPDGGIVWIESAKSAESARERIKLLVDYKPGEYVVFCEETQSIIAMPLVSFALRKAETISRAKPAITRKAKTRVKSSGKPKTSEVVGKIVADISRTLRH
jgi:hypothetical protein